MLKIVYKILWTFIMLMLDIFERLYYILKLCKLKIMNIIYFGNFKNDKKYLKLCQNDLNKIPKHLSIIIGLENNIDSDVLLKFIIYSLISNINYISFYDVNGNLQLEQLNIPKFINCKKIKNDRLLLTMHGEKNEFINGHKNGLDKSIEVVNLSPIAGISLAVEVCKTLLYTVKDSLNNRDSFKIEDNLTDKINEAFQKRLNYLPDPDLAIIFDKTICTYGLLPWQTGFTEFHNIDIKNYIDVQIFAKILYKYAKCEQRFGK